MLEGLESLNIFNDKQRFIPSYVELVYHYFFKHGVSLKDFYELPIPYIVSIVRTKAYLVEEEKKELEDSKR